MSRCLNALGNRPTIQAGVRFLPAVEVLVVIRVRTMSGVVSVLAAGAVALLAATGVSAQPGSPACQPGPSWARGIEGQRKADLGNGTFLNPVLSGDRPDPSILKDGADYYLVNSSFDAYPGLPIWRSRDLVNWTPVGAALRSNVGSVWAPDIVKHEGRYYIYFPGRKGAYRSNYVVWADRIEGPWSDPIDLKIGQIDPGHIVGEDGRRYLFLSAGYYVALAPDGLSVAGEMKKVYDGWKYPEEWDVEGFAQEGPKMLRHGDYFYMVLAEGGTAGPPTSHMVVVARSKSIHGPWENAPNNPVVRTKNRDEYWWSKGHATMFEGPGGQWYLVYHGYENGFWTLGRQTLLEPARWTADGWIETTGVDMSRPLPMPNGEAVPHGFAFSDDFTTNTMGRQWSFYDGDNTDTSRYRYENGTLVIKGKGTAPRDASPLSFVCGDLAYEVEVEMDLDAGAKAGLLVFYNGKLYAGLGYTGTNLVLHRYGTERDATVLPNAPKHLFMRLRNDRHVVTMWHSLDGRTWTKFDNQIEVSGYHHNVAYDFLSLRPALYAAGKGEVRFRNFKYRALP